ncbi:MAG: DHHA1 domain-containing protein, partial [bacterium]|nr:DHHA1 domain-containing protein [bacterium]
QFIFPVGQEKWLLDMVGLATMSDMVPLTGENRVFAHFGLTVLRKSPRIGLGQLLQELRINRRELNEDDIGFSISPRINAASRMGVPMDAFKLFATTDMAEAGALAKHLNRINDERKGKVASLVKEVRKIVAERHPSTHSGQAAPTVVVAGNPNWRPALLGLVANALVEDYAKPVFVWGREGGEELKGSCRSGGGVDVTALMQEARSVFTDFGGHKEAGGFSVVLEKVHLMEAELERAYELVRTAVNTSPKYLVDARMRLEEANRDTWQEINQLAPFGVGNPKPLFLFEQVVIGKVEIFGKQKQHLKLTFEKKSGEKISAVRFFTKPDDFSVPLVSGERINLLAHLEKSTFRDITELRLRIVDIV